MSLARAGLVGLALRLAAHRWQQSLGLALAGIVLGAPVVGLAAAHGSGIEAIKDSVRAEFGYPHGWKLQANRQAAPIVARTPGLTSVSVREATVATPTARVTSPVWLLGDGRPPLGVLLDGRRARSSGEATLSRHLAESLSIGLGSSVTLTLADGADPFTATIVGTTSDPAQRDADLLITVPSGTAAGDAAHVSYWVARDAPPSLELTVGMTAASATSTTERRLERPPGPVAALGRALPVVTILVLLVALAAVAAQVPSARRDVAALEAAGMPSRRAWRVASTWIGLLVAAGAAVGALGVLVAMTLLSDSISAAFGQRWTSVDLPWVSLLLVVLVPLLICVAPVQRADALLSWLRRDDRAAWGTGRAAAITGVAAVGAGVAAICLALLALHGHVEVRQPWGLGMLGLVAVAIGARLAANALAGTRRPRATAAVIRRLAGQLTTGTSVALLIGTACAGYSAWLTHDTRALAGLNLAPQRPGSFLVYEAPAAAADQVLERYRSAGGRHAVLYQLPDEADGTVRVITTALMACVHAEAGGAPDPVQPCLEQAHGQEAAMGLPALDPDLPAGTVLAAKDLVDPAGQTGLVAYAPDGSGRVTRTGTTRATASPELGGNMPGLVLSPNGPLAQDYGLKPSGLVEFGIFDFGHLDPRLAAQIRAQVATLAPAAQVSDSTESTSTDQDLAIALVVALAGAVLALILQTSTAAAVVSGGRRLRTTIASVGITATQRLAISLRVVAPALVGVAVAWLATAIVAPRLSMRADVSMGWAWMLPYAVQAAVMLITGVVLLRAPRDC